VIVFISGRLTMIFGLAGSAISMIDTVSLPAGCVIVLPVFSSNETFSSLPVIRSCARAGPADASKIPAAALSADSRKVDFPVGVQSATQVIRALWWLSSDARYLFLPALRIFASSRGGRRRKIEHSGIH